MSGKRIVFTGGSGKAGRHAVPHLVAHGYSVLNVDLKPLDLPGVPTLIADLTDSGQAFNALTTHPSFAGFEVGQPPRPPDAVVHFAAMPRVLIEPDNVTFTKNVISTYNVIEAAMKLGVRKVVIASSETTYGVCFAEGDKDFHAFPLEEDYDVDPMDSYGLSKVCNEKTARAFAMRYGADIYALRIGNVIEPHEYGMFTALPRRPADAASATPGATSTRATSARSCGSAWKRTASASRCSTRPTTRSPSTRRPAKRWRSSARTRRSPAQWASSKRRCRTARRARCSASRRSTTGGNTSIPPTTARDNGRHSRAVAGEGDHV